LVENEDVEDALLRNEVISENSLATVINANNMP
jgi:hypothetical protein